MIMKEMEEYMTDRGVNWDMCGDKINLDNSVVKQKDGFIKSEAEGGYYERQFRYKHQSRLKDR